MVNRKRVRHVRCHPKKIFWIIGLEKDYWISKIEQLILANGDKM